MYRPFQKEQHLFVMETFHNILNVFIVALLSVVSHLDSIQLCCSWAHHFGIYQSTVPHLKKKTIKRAVQTWSLTIHA